MAGSMVKGKLLREVRPSTSWYQQSNDVAMMYFFIVNGFPVLKMVGFNTILFVYQTLFEGSQLKLIAFQRRCIEKHPWFEKI